MDDHDGGIAIRVSSGKLNVAATVTVALAASRERAGGNRRSCGLERHGLGVDLRRPLRRQQGRLPL